MANKKLFNFSNNLDTTSEEVEEEKKEEEKEEEFEDTAQLVLSKKTKNKDVKNMIPIYMNRQKQKEIDKVAKMLGYSRNELINKFIDFGMGNLKIKK